MTKWIPEIRFKGNVSSAAPACDQTWTCFIFIPSFQMKCYDQRAWQFIGLFLLYLAGNFDSRSPLACGFVSGVASPARCEVSRYSGDSDPLWPWRNLEAGRSILLWARKRDVDAVPVILSGRKNTRCCVKCFPFYISSSQLIANVHVQERRIFVEIQESR